MPDVCFCAGPVILWNRRRRPVVSDHHRCDIIGSAGPRMRAVAVSRRCVWVMVPAVPGSIAITRHAGADWRRCAELGEVRKAGRPAPPTQTRLAREHRTTHRVVREADHRRCSSHASTVKYAGGRPLYAAPPLPAAGALSSAAPRSGKQHVALTRTKRWAARAADRAVSPQCGMNLFASHQ